MDDIDKILRRAARGSFLSKILDFLPGIVIAILVISLLWTCSYGPLNANYSNINHGDRVKIISGTYRGVIGRADMGDCIEPFSILVRDVTFKKYYSCKAWWSLEKID